MGTIRSDLDPTPAQGLAYDISKLSPKRFVLTKSGAQTVGTDVARVTNTTGEVLILKNVEVSLGTAPTGATFIADANVAGTTVYSAQAQRPTVAIGQKTASSVPARATKPVKWLPGEVLSVDVDQIGSTVAGSDLTVAVEAYKGRSDAEDITVDTSALV